VIHDVATLVTNLMMVVFFAAIGLEIGRERAEGSLVDGRSAVLPVLAALGGMAMAALVYVGVVTMLGAHGALVGWGIPMATDVAFTLGVISLVGTRVSISLRVFLLALAVADDVASVIVLALTGRGSTLGSTESSVLSLAGVVLLIGATLLARHRRAPWPTYIALTLALWWCLAHLGIEATLAGVLVGVAVPAGHDHTERAGAQLERLTVPLSTYLVLPAFALVAGGVDLATQPWRHGTGVLFGVLAARTIGKVVGIVGAVALAVRFGVAALPDETSWRQMLGAGLLCGIGFTVPLLFATRAFARAPLLLDETKVALLLASVLCAIFGLCVLVIGSTRSRPKG
jgi:NhaA family Na+:H+ antiporter